ncbi:MAG: hypothetical protein Q9187_006705, partial [Circinaria calcarea]
MSALSALLPLLLLLVVLTLAALIGYIIYSIANDVAGKTAKKMEGKNVVFSKEGMRVGVREVKGEDVVGRTQSILVKAWNFSTWPAYKSRFWNKEKEGAREEHAHAPVQARKP